MRLLTSAGAGSRIDVEASRYRARLAEGRSDMYGAVRQVRWSLQFVHGRRG